MSDVTNCACDDEECCDLCCDQPWQVHPEGCVKEPA